MGPGPCGTAVIEGDNYKNIPSRDRSANNTILVTAGIVHLLHRAP
jgi:hypothetical protein